MYFNLQIKLFLFVCSFNFIFGQSIPPWLEFVGLTSTKAYYLSNATSGPTLDVAESKFECMKYGMRLATLDTEAINLLNDFLIYEFGLNVSSPQIWTSARFSVDFTRNFTWTTSGEPVPEEIITFRGPTPGESAYLWYECPPLRRTCPNSNGCGVNPGPSFKTGLIHDIAFLASSNCLLKNAFLCQRSR